MKDRRAILALVAILGMGLLLAGWGLFQQQQRISENAATIRQQSERAQAQAETARQARERTSRELQALEQLVRQLGGTPPPRAETTTAPQPAVRTTPEPPASPLRGAERSPRPTPPAPTPTRSRPSVSPSPTASTSPSPSCLVTIRTVCVGGRQ